jgi:hypothetical protein
MAMAYTASLINDRRSAEKAASNSTEACVLPTNEEKQWARFAWSWRHGLRIRSNGTNGDISQGSSRQSVRGAPPSTIFS